jgi:hypothetical protein
LSEQARLGKIDRTARRRGRFALVRFLLPIGWFLAAIGYFGPWLAHPTAALTLSGVDMGEFVKFLPEVLEGSLSVTRQIFYLPPFAVVAGIALLVGSQDLRYPWLPRLLLLLGAIPVSLQILPPAWSPASLLTSEFRLQTVALVTSWLLLACWWFWTRIAVQLTGSLSAALAFLAAALPAWQLLIVKPSVDKVYGTPPSVGWGFLVCMLGLAIVAAMCILLVLRARLPAGEQ